MDQLIDLSSQSLRHRYKVLIVEDDQDNRELIEGVLSMHFDTVLAHDGEEAIKLARAELPHVVLLDIGIPKVSGLTVCEELRKSETTRRIPIVVLSGNNGSDRRVQAFTKGADDYISKPFHPRELVVRILSKIQRNSEFMKESDVLFCGNLYLNTQKMEVKVGEKVVPLSVLEFDLLKYFVVNKDHVLSREKVLAAVWKSSIVSDRTVDAHLVSLRKKLTYCDHVIATVYGAGYVFKERVVEQVQIA